MARYTSYKRVLDYTNYKRAVDWIAGNDDTEWVDHDPESACGTPSVTACLVADLFDKPVEEVRQDIKRVLNEMYPVRKS